MARARGWTGGGEVEGVGGPLKTNKLIYWIKILLRYSYWISDALFFVLIHFLLLETF